MFSSTRVFVALAVVLASAWLLGAPAAQATVINIANGDFEDPVLADGVYNYTIAGWTIHHGDAGTTNNPSTQLQPHSGGNTAYFGGFGDTGAWGYGGVLYQPLMIGSNPVQFTQQGDQVTVSLYQGKNTYVTGTQDLRIEIGDETGAINTALDHLDVPVGTWVQRNVTLTCTNASQFNAPLYVYLDGHYNSAENQLDDVTGTFTPAPEPSAVILLTAGLIGLLAYAWRKRK